MTIDMRVAKRRLAMIWFVGAGLLFLTVLLQTILGHYHDLAERAWEWLLPSIMPTLSLIIGVLVSDFMGKGRADRPVDAFLFRMAAALSAAYLVTVSLPIFLHPFSNMTELDLMAMSHLWQGPFQGLVGAALGAFFVSREAAP